MGRFLPPGPGPVHDLGGLDRRFPPGGPVSPGGGGGLGFNRNPNQDYWNSLGLDGRGPGEASGSGSGSIKRKYSEEEEKEIRLRDEKEDFAKRRQQQQYMPYGNPNGFPVGPGHRGGEVLAGNNGDHLRANKYMRTVGGYNNSVGFRQGTGSGSGDQVSHIKHLEVDQSELKKAFLRFAKSLNESANQRKNYLENGKHSRIQCLACSRFDEIGSALTLRIVCSC